MSDKKLKLGVSACLLGEKVRFNAGHCKNHYITTSLDPFCTFVPTCPEAAIGLGTPREAVRLEQSENGYIEMVGTKSGNNHTDKITAFSQSWANYIRNLDLDGYILKKDSPSCGVFRVKIYKNHQVAERRGTGLFAKAIMEAHPHLPVEEDGRLNDPALREHFLERTFAYRRLKDLFAGNWSRHDLITFHAREKMLLMAHNPAATKKLGQLVAQIKNVEPAEFHKQYLDGYMAIVGNRASKGRHTNTLSHLSGYVKNQLSPSARKEIKDTIEEYRNGQLPLIVPITLLKHLIRRFDCTYLAEQSYLDPHPRQLMLRNYS